MGFIGVQPTSAPLTSSDITDDIVNSDHLGNTTISGFDALTESPADTDEFLISDGGVLKRIDASLVGGSSTADTFFATSGLSSKDLGAGLHIKTADTGGSASGDADELVIEGTGHNGMTILSGASHEGSINFADSGANRRGFYSYDHSVDSAFIGTSGSIKVKIDSSGDIYVGKTTGGQNVAGIKLEGSSGTVLGTRDQAVAGIFTRLNNDGEVIRIMSNTSTVGTISISGSSTAYNTSSDYRLKENEVAISDGIERLKQLKPYRFNFKADADTTVDGFFAHEVSSVVPEAISGDKDAMHPEVLYTADDELPEGKEIGDVKEETKINPQAIDQSKLVPLLTSALQEAITKIETLEARVKTLEDA
jgi:hypothetical protein